MSKKPSARIARVKNTTVPPLTDPRLTALLLFLTETESLTDRDCLEPDFARAVADADAMLTSYPLSTAFERCGERPSISDQVRAACEANREATIGVFATAFDGDDEDEQLTLRAEDVQFLFWETTDQALLRGACLMYRLLEGRQRYDGAR